YCTASDMGPDATVAHFLQADMASTDRLDIVVTYPEGAAEGEPLLTQRWSLASAFAVTPATASVFGMLLLVLVGGLIARARRRGARTDRHAHRRPRRHRRRHRHRPGPDRSRLQPVGGVASRTCHVRGLAPGPTGRTDRRRTPALRVAAPGRTLR